MENPAFYNILDQKEFYDLTAPEQIKMCLEKEIFTIWENRTNRIKDLKTLIPTLDLSSFAPEIFSFQDVYSIQNFQIKLNYSVTNGLYDSICDSIRNSGLSYQYMEGLRYQLIAYASAKEKIKFLRSEIGKIDPFKLPDIIIGFDWELNRLDVSPEHSSALNEENPYLLDNWLFGTFNPREEDDYKGFKELEKFWNSYQQYVLIDLCFDEIENINQKEIPTLATPQIIKDDLVEVNQKNWTTYEFAYLFEKLGIVDKMKATGLSFEKVSEIIGSAINRNPKNFRTCVLEIVRTPFNDLEDGRKNSQQKIDPIIRHFRNSE